MQQPPTLKLEMLNFIEENLVPRPDNLNDLTTLSQIKKMLEEIIRNRERSLTEEGVDPDDWGDDDILGQAEEYINELNAKRLENEKQNIEFTRNVSLATKKGRTPSNSKLPYLPEVIEKKIQSYGVKKPNNSKSKYEKIVAFGLKTKTPKKSRRSRKSRKSRKNKRKTRKSRK